MAEVNGVINGVASDRDSPSPPPGLLERSALQDGKRERRKTDRLESVAPKEKVFKIPEGSGTPLGKCPMIESNLQKLKPDELKPLHRVLFKTPGQLTTLKSNIRKFNGFEFKKESHEYENKSQQLNKMVIEELKKICLLMDLERGGSKEELKIRVLEFLLKPSPSGKVPTKSKKKSKSKGLKKVKKPKAGKEIPELDLSNSSGSDKQSEDEQNEENEYEAEDKSEDDEPKKKPAPKKKEPKAEKPKAAKRKATPKKKSAAMVDDDMISSDSDDEPLAAKKKPKLPTDAEIKDLVKSLLKEADLDNLTMKSVCNDVYENYPGLDLTSKKDFIKATVKKIIA